MDWGIYFRAKGLGDVGPTAGIAVYPCKDSTLQKGIPRPLDCALSVDCLGVYLQRLGIQRMNNAPLILHQP